MASRQQIGEEGDLLQAMGEYFRDSEHVVTAFRVARSQASWSVAGRRTRLTTKPRILALTVKRSNLTQKNKARLQVLKESPTGFQAEKVYKLSHLNKVEGVPEDKSGCTFALAFDILQNQTVSSPQWIMRSVNDRNGLLMRITKLCKEHHGRTPKIVGMDVVEMALWAQANAKAVPVKAPVAEEVVDVKGEEEEVNTSVEEENHEDLVSKVEEEDMEALLGTYVLGIDEAEAFSERLKRELTALEAANVHAILESEPLVEEVLQQLDAASGSLEDVGEWLNIFNVKLRHMREDIESIEARNNRLDVQAQNNSSLVGEMHELLERLRVPPEFAATLTIGAFDEARMPQNVEACDWLAAALRGLEPPFLDAGYASLRAVTDKRVELEKLKSTFVGRASSFLRDYFSSVVEFMISDKSYFSQKGQLKRPDHSDLRFKCRTYARMLQHMKVLDRNSLAPLRKAYCHSLNLLLRREAREFANELKASTRVASGAGLDRLDSGGPVSPVSPQRPAKTLDTSTVSEAYAKMLRIFIPLLVDESSFFASFMCFEVQPLTPQASGDVDKDDEDDITAMDIDGSDIKANAGVSGHTKAWMSLEPHWRSSPILPRCKVADQSPAELEALNQALLELLDGIQEDFYAVVDWAHRVHPLSCISMQGVTERYLSTQKADAAGFVRRLLAELQKRVAFQFNQLNVQAVSSETLAEFINEANNQIERHDRGQKQTGVLSYFHKFADLAAQMEALIGDNSRDVVDDAYAKLVKTMFDVLERIAQHDSKTADVFLLENYAAFQNRMYDLATVVPAMEPFYNQASDSYEQACVRYVNTLINYQFEKLFQFGQKVEHLLLTMQPEEVPFQPGCSKLDLRRITKASLSGVEKSFTSMYKRMQKNLQQEQLLQPLWDEKFKETFLEKYKSLEALLATCYKGEPLSPTSAEMKQILESHPA